MNNLSSYCGLVDAKIKASDKDLPACDRLSIVLKRLRDFKFKLSASKKNSYDDGCKTYRIFIH